MRDLTRISSGVVGSSTSSVDHTGDLPVNRLAAPDRLIPVGHPLTPVPIPPEAEVPVCTTSTLAAARSGSRRWLGLLASVATLQQSWPNQDHASASSRRYRLTPSRLTTSTSCGSFARYNTGVR
jgi:hypothetical protein